MVLGWWCQMSNPKCKCSYAIEGQEPDKIPNNLVNNGRCVAHFVTNSNKTLSTAISGIKNHKSITKCIDRRSVMIQSLTMPSVSTVKSTTTSSHGIISESTWSNGCFVPSDSSFCFRCKFPHSRQMPRPICQNYLAYQSHCEQLQIRTPSRVACDYDESKQFMMNNAKKCQPTT